MSAPRTSIPRTSLSRLRNCGQRSGFDNHVRYPSIVQTDLFGQLVLLSQPGSYDLIDEIVPATVDRNAYIYLSPANVWDNLTQAEASGGSYQVAYRSNLAFFNRHFSTSCTRPAPPGSTMSRDSVTIVQGLALSSRLAPDVRRGSQGPGGRSQSSSEPPRATNTIRPEARPAAPIDPSSEWGSRSTRDSASASATAFGTARIAEPLGMSRRLGRSGMMTGRPND